MKYTIEKATRFPCPRCNYDNEHPLQDKVFHLDFVFIPEKEKDRFEFRCCECKSIITSFNMDFMTEENINELKEKGLDIYNWKFSGLQVWAIKKTEKIEA